MTVAVAKSSWLSPSPSSVVESFALIASHPSCTYYYCMDIAVPVLLPGHHYSCTYSYAQLYIEVKSRLTIH